MQTHLGGVRALPRPSHDGVSEVGRQPGGANPWLGRTRVGQGLSISVDPDAGRQRGLAFARVPVFAHLSSSRTL